MHVRGYIIASWLCIENGIFPLVKKIWCNQLVGSIYFRRWNPMCGSMRLWDKYEFGVINYIAVVIGNGAKCMHVLWCYFEIWNTGWDRYLLRSEIYELGLMMNVSRMCYRVGIVLRMEPFYWETVLMYNRLIGSEYSGKVNVKWWSGINIRLP